MQHRKYVNTLQYNPSETTKFDDLFQSEITTVITNKLQIIRKCRKYSIIAILFLIACTCIEPINEYQTPMSCLLDVYAWSEFDRVHTS